MIGIRRPLSITIAALVVSGLSAAMFLPQGPEAKAALGPLQVITLGPDDFQPRNSSTRHYATSWDNAYLWSDGTMVSRIPFPAEQVMVTGLKLRVYDNEDPADLCYRMYRAEPNEMSTTTMRWGCTSGASDTDPQILQESVSWQIGGYRSAYLWVKSEGAANQLRFYGAQILYQVVT
jgi:hypothetical protein